jgi:hypothetical protein
MQGSCASFSHIGGTVDRSWRVPGGAPALLTERAVPLLRPEDQVFDEMLAGWRDQQLSRNLRQETIENRLALIRRFHRFSAEYPWAWTPQDLESFTSELRGGDSPAALSTVRGYKCAIRLFLEFASDPRYAWTAVCEQMFGTHPAQICFEWNTAQHSADSEGRPQRRALTKAGAPALLRLRR